jgi:hypothetical protein
VLLANCGVTIEQPVTSGPGMQLPLAAATTLDGIWTGHSAAPATATLVCRAGPVMVAIALAPQ